MCCSILLIQGHPDPDPARLCRALGEAYAEGAVEAGHRVERLDLAALEIPLLRSQEDFERGEPPETVRAAQRALQAARHVVLIFPLWLGAPPALVKAFLEQLLRPGFVFAPRESGPPRKLLSGRSVRLVVTLGMPAPVYRFWFLAHGLKALERNVLRFVGFGPLRRSLFGGIESASEKTRGRWLARMRRLGAEGA